MAIGSDARLFHARLAMYIGKGFFSFIFALFFCLQKGAAYHQPLVDLGYHNILDGGPLRIASGWYLEGFPQYYRADKFLNSEGGNLGGIPSPILNISDMVVELFYQSNQTVLFNGKWGFSATLPVTFYSHIEKNHLGITDSGAGFGDLFLGLTLQWETIKIDERPILTHRIAFDASFPSGKFEAKKSINPGNGIYFINPYWAATLYFTPKWSASWRFRYLWNAENSKTHIQAGDAIHFNYSLQYEAVEKFWLAVVGYFLQQLKLDQLNGAIMPKSLERVFAIGPGALYSVSKDLFLFGYLYFETDVRNRPKGINFISRFLYSF